MDLSYILGIEKSLEYKYEGSSYGIYPYDVPEPNSIRVESAPTLLDELNRYPYHISRKLNGASITTYWRRNDFHICSHDAEILDEDNPYYSIATKWGMKDRLLHRMHLAVQGELVGPDIEGNGEKLDSLEMYVFDLYDMDKCRYLDVDELYYMCSKLGLRPVPLVEVGEAFTHTIDSLYALSDSVGGEGIVLRPYTDTYSDSIMDRISIKILNEYRR